MEISDDALIKIAVAGTGAYAAHFLAAPRHSHDLYFTKTTPYNPATTRWFGFGLAGIAVEGLAVLDASKDTKKTMLKTLGAVWLASSALHLLHVQEGTQKKELGTWQAVGHGVFGAFCLWRGYSD